MRRVELYLAMLPGPGGRMRRSRWRMTREEAAARGGVIIEGSLEVRQVPETDEEMRRLLPGARMPYDGPIW